MCVQLADSTIRYPEGVVERLMVKVRNTYILVDFVVLDMEGDLGIPLILGRPFLKDTNARIDVGTGRISLRIMGRPWSSNSKTRGRYSWFMRIVRNRGYGQNPIGMTKTITPPPSQFGRIGRFILHQPSQWKTSRRSLISSPIQCEKIRKSSILHPRILFLRRLRHQRRTRCHWPLLLLQVWTKWPQPDQVWRKVLLFGP